MTRMHNPPHPGEVLKDGVMGPNLNVTQLADVLGVDRVTLSRLLNGRADISAAMAVRLAKALGGSAESWMHMQAAYDLWQAEHRKDLMRTVAKIEKLKDFVLVADQEAAMRTRHVTFKSTTSLRSHKKVSNRKKEVQTT